MIADTKQVSGLKIFKVCRFNDELCAAIIALSDNWQELLDTIESPEIRRNIEPVVRQLREALGKE